MASKSTDDPSPFDDDETTSGGFSFVAWGFATAVSVTLGLASWQFAPPQVASFEVARAEVQLPDPTEVTGSVARPDRPVAAAARVVGSDRVSPMPLAADTRLATSRDIDQLRTEVRDLQRRLTQAGLSGDGLSQRLDKLEERLTVDPEVARDRLARAAAPSDKTDAKVVADRVDAPKSPEPAKPTEPAKAAEAPKPAEAVRLVALPVKPAEAVRPVEKLPEKSAERPTDRPSDKPAEPAVASGERPVPNPDRADRLVVERIPVPAARPADADPGAVRTVRSVAPVPGGEADGPTTTGTVARTNPIAVTPPVAPPPPPTAEAAAQPGGAKGDLLVPPKPDPAGAKPDPAARGDFSTASVPPSVSASEPPAAVDLGGYRSLATLRRAWNDLSGRNSELGRGLAPLARLRETEAGIEARLLAGPYANQTEAAKSCMRLRAAGVACSVAVYSGQAVTQR